MIRRACAILSSRSTGACAAAIAADRADDAREPGLAMAGWSLSRTITRFDPTSGADVTGAALVADVTDCDGAPEAALAGT